MTDYGDDVFGQVEEVSHTPIHERFAQSRHLKPY